MHSTTVVLVNTVKGASASMIGEPLNDLFFRNIFKNNVHR